MYMTRCGVELRAHVEHLSLLWAHVLAHKLPPELAPFGPPEPLDSPEVLHVARPRHRPPEAHVPARKNRLAQLALQDLLCRPGLALRCDVPVQKRRAAHVDPAQDNARPDTRRLKQFFNPARSRP